MSLYIGRLIDLLIFFDLPEGGYIRKNSRGIILLKKEHTMYYETSKIYSKILKMQKYAKHNFIQKTVKYRKIWLHISE